MPSIVKKKVSSKKYKKHLFSSFQMTKSTQTIGSFFADRIKQVKTSKLEAEPVKIECFFLDGHGNYTSINYFSK